MPLGSPGDSEQPLEDERLARNAPQGEPLARASDEVTPEALRWAEAMPQLVWVAAPDGTIEYFNHTWIRYTGTTVDDMKAAGDKGILHPDDAGITRERWNGALATGKAYETEYRLRSAKDGTYRWFLARAIPVRDAGGTILQWVGTATDIDDQKRANANLRFALEAAASLAPSYDVNAICSALAELSVNRVCDWCFVLLSDASGSTFRMAAAAHRNAARIRETDRFEQRASSLRGGRLAAAIRKGRPILVPDVTANDLRKGAGDEEQFAFLQSLHVRSAMVVPLAAERRVHGALVLLSTESTRTFRHEDLEVAEMVGQRAANAIETAKAFGEERRRSGDLQFIAKASEIIFQSLDLQQTFDRLTTFLAAGMADLAYIVLVEDGEALRTVSGAHADPAKNETAMRLCGQRTLRPAAEETAIHMLSAGRPVLHASIPIDAVLANMWDYLAPYVRQLDIRSAITVPLHLRGETFGALVAYRCAESERAFRVRDVPLFEDIARRLSIAMDHARTLERERRIAQALQAALLPPPGALPDGEGIKFSAEYRVSSREAGVGGDWYDALPLRDGSILVSVGDVTGRGLAAAGLMGNLRQGVAMATLYETDPARILDALDMQLRMRGTAEIATAFVGIIDPERKNIRFATAGHPAPLLRRAGELVELRSNGLPLGLRDAAREESITLSLNGAELLLLYTDGLIEATRDIAFGERRLHEVASSEAILYVRDASRFVCDACLPLDAQDDTAVLTVSFGQRAHWSFDAENAQAAHDARSEFVAHLRRRAGPQEDFEAAELIFGELVGNVVRHAPGAIDVQLQWTDRHPVLHVTDRGKGFVRNPSLPSDPLSESGRGLYIISLLARSVRIERVPGYGNHIAVELSVGAEACAP